MKQTKPNKIELQKELKNLDISLVAVYLMDSTEYYYDIAKIDAENLLNENEKEFNRVLEIAKKHAKCNWG